MGKKKKTKPTLAIVRVPNQKPMRPRGPTSSPDELAQLITQALTENADLRAAVQKKQDMGE